MIINSYRYKDSGIILPDYTGFGITRLYTPFKTNLATHNTFATIRKYSGGTYQGEDGDVGFDDAGLLTRSSPYSGASGSTLNDIFGTGIAWPAESLYCQISNHELSGGTEDRSIYTVIDQVGSIPEKNSFPVIDISNAGSNRNSFRGAAVSELNSGNTFTISIVVYNKNASNIAVALSTTDASNPPENRLNINCDRSSNKIHSLVKAGGTTNINYYASQIDNDDYRILHLKVDGTAKTFEAYLGKTLVDSGSFTGSYENTALQLGAQINKITDLNGGIGWVSIANEYHTTTQTDNLTDKLEIQFNM